METKPKKQKLLIMDEDTGRMIHSGEDRRSPLLKLWTFMGFDGKDIVKGIFYFTIGVSIVTQFYLETESMKKFIADQSVINAHLTLCNDNRDKWASAKYGHMFECGRPNDGWTPTFGNLKNQ